MGVQVFFGLFETMNMFYKVFRVFFFFVFLGRNMVEMSFSWSEIAQLDFSTTRGH
jgi:hypothetical protein